MRFFKSVTIFALLTAFVACSSHKTTVSTGDATVSSDDANKTTTITTKDGSETIGKNAVDPAKLGVPVYPGAQAGESGVSVAGASGTTQMVSLTTTDSFDKVFDWYQGQLPKEDQTMKISNQDSSTAEFTIGANGKSPATATIMITSKKDKTDILIFKGTK